MEIDEVTPQANWEGDSPIGAALLLVIGEPVTDDHQSLILEEITKGFRCWNEEETGIDINEELARIANRADMGEEGPNVIVTGPDQSESFNERTIQHRSEKIAVEILVNPRLQTLQLALQNYLMMPASHRHLIYAGHYFGGNGSWVLQDDSFSVSQLGRLCKDSDIEAALKQQDGGKMTIYCNTGGEWKPSNIGKLDVSKSLTLELNPEERLTNVHGILQFTAYIGNFIHAKTIQQLMRTSDVVGNIRFSKPTLYIFPACEGDSAMFGISGFNLLINGGYSRKSCFWDFARHLDRIDAVLMTHLGTDNIFGISSVLKRKSMETVHPDIGFMYLNASDKASSTPEVNGENGKEPKLVINLAEEGSKLLEFSKHLGPTPQPCVRTGNAAMLQPVNLYHKVGHGSLDMYILNPVSDSKELKDFYQQWNKQVMEFGSAQNVPLPNMLSICCLLVWQPADPDANINRLFFPGNAPQYKIIEGLEKLKHLKFLKKAACTSKDLEAKPVAKKPNTPAGKPTTAKPAPKPTLDKKTENKAAVPKTATSSKSNKVSKEDENKKKAEDKGSKSRPSTGGLNKTAPKSGKLDLSSTKKPVSTTTPKKTSPTEAKKKLASTQSPRPSSKKEAEKATPSKQKSPSPEKKSPSPVVTAPPPMEEIISHPAEPTVDVLSGGQGALIDITPEDPQIKMGDTLVPTQETSESSTKKSDSPDPLPDPNQFEVAPNQNENSLMYGSFHQDLQEDILTPQHVSNNMENGQGDDGDMIQPESLPEPEMVTYPPQEPDLIPDMSPMSKEPVSNDEPEQLIKDVTAEPDVVPSFRNEDESQLELEESMKQSDADVNPAMEKDDTPDMESPEEEHKDIALPPQDGMNQYESDPKVNQTESLSEEADEPVLQKHEDDEFMKEQETVMTPEVMPEPVELEQAQEKADVSDHAIDEDVVDDYDDGDISPDEMDSQGDVRETDLPDDNVQGDVSPYAFENKGFTEGSCEYVPDEAATEPVDDLHSENRQQCVDSFDKDDNVKEHQIEDLKQDEQDGGVFSCEKSVEQSTEDENQCQNGEYLEVSNIPEAFEKDETPDPVEMRSSDVSKDTAFEQFPEKEDTGIQEQVPSVTESYSGGYSSFIGLQDKPLDPNAEPFNPFVGVDNNSQQNVSPAAGGEASFDPFFTIDNSNVEGNQSNNPFTCSGQQSQDCYPRETNGQTFDPKDWGEPLGLPAPPPPDGSPATDGPTNGKAAEKSPVKSKPGATKRVDSARSANKAKLNEKPDAPSSARTTKTNGIDSKLKTNKARPASAATHSSEPKTKLGRRPATATGSRASPASAKTPPLPPMTPFYSDLSYIPNHGNPQYSDIEFFKRIRARYYVLSSLSPNSQVLNALLDAKETWEDKDLKVTIIPTYDNDTMRHWMGLNKDRLCDLNVDVAPSATRCTIQLQDHETSCSAFRLEF